MKGLDSKIPRVRRGYAVTGTMVIRDEGGRDRRARDDKNFRLHQRQLNSFGRSPRAAGSKSFTFADLFKTPRPMRLGRVNVKRCKFRRSGTNLHANSQSSHPRPHGEWNTPVRLKHQNAFRTLGLPLWRQKERQKTAEVQWPRSSPEAGCSKDEAPHSRNEKPPRRCDDDMS